jgi:glyoxylase-like metal-dependent hydrolase (beta-lactamase superfamily II)
MWKAGLACVMSVSACRWSPAPPPPATGSARWCDLLPRPANAALERVSVSTGWFEVYRAADGVFAIAEPFQFQEAISYLIVGTDRALMFDTGLGLVPIRPVVEQLTRLPVDVLNSHTHFDHVGGNAEFDRILALDTPYTRANARGFDHAAVAGEVAPDSFCRGAPKGTDTAAFRTRPWTATRTVGDLDKIDLGGRVLEILHVPGHTPDAIALVDRAKGLLWTGDSYYDGTIWLYVPETNLDDYERSIARLAALAPRLEKLLPAHNTASAEPRRLVQAKDAIRQVRTGAMKGTEESDHRLVFAFDGFSILVSKPLLQGKTGDATRGGSGLATWR